MDKYLPTIIYSLIVSLTMVSLLYLTQSSNNRFIIKGAIFSGVILVYVVLLFYLKYEHIVCLLIFMSLMDVPIRQLYTSSTNVLIFIALLVIYVRNTFIENTGSLYERIKNNSITLPLILVICSYSISLLFAKKSLGDHFEMYHSILCVSLLIWMIIGAIQEKSQIIAINTVLLVVLLLNLAFSFVFILYPEIDTIRAHVLSLAEFTDEGASRLQGLSFRGEAYGEYLMICALWLFTMLVRGELRKGRIFFWLLTVVTVSALIMTRLRGANGVFLLGTIVVLLTSGSVPLWKRTVALSGIVLVFTGSLFVLQTYSNEPTLLDRFYLFSDTSKNVGYIPKTRYYTWMPAFRQARANNFMGTGPSFAPYIEETKWKDIVAGREVTWPHNITLIVLCTVGIYGLLCYLFLVYRAVRLRRIFDDLDSYLKSCYSGYLICFTMFLLEAQKYDGFLRHPSSDFYYIFILIALLFSCENLVNFSRNEIDEQHVPSTRT
jgi:hypothetical protein